MVRSVGTVIMGHRGLFRCVSYYGLITTKSKPPLPSLCKLLHTSPVYDNSQSSSKTSSKLKLDAKQISNVVSSIPLERMRNFSIIAHIDHGKSTLADRLLEITGAIEVTGVKNEQILDKLQVERERGITVKAQTASLVYNYQGEDYLLNLIDTPGHVDFNFEVARSLSACQGVILLVDANQGVQAQTVANFFLAFEKDLVIVPVMNKIDLQVARPEEVVEQIQNVFEIPPDEVLRISAKLGKGVEDVIHAVIDRIPPPPGDVTKPFQALFFDSSYDRYRGVIANVAVRNGVVKKGDKIVALHSDKTYDVQEIGILQAKETPVEQLSAGQVGYLIAGIRKTSEVLIGDTFCNAANPADALPGFKPAKPMVFAGVFPIELSEYTNLKNSLDKLLINDCSIQVNKDNSAALGPGWRLGFLGLLHMEVFTQRLEQEFGTSVIVTTPNVPYKVKITGAQNIKNYGSEEMTVLNPCLLPDRSIISEYQEPYVQGTVISPDNYISGIMSLFMERRAQNITQNYIDNKRIMFKAVLPLSEIIVDFFDNLKALTSGYASFDYEDFGYQLTDLVKIDIYLNGQIVEELAQIVHVSRALTVSKHLTHKLQESLPRQLFEIAVQAKMGSKVLSRTNIKPYRKDVTAKLYGGDVRRRMKLLRRQSEGKKKMRKIGNIDVPKETFIDVLKK